MSTTLTAVTPSLASRPADPAPMVRPKVPAADGARGVGLAAATELRAGKTAKGKVAERLARI